MHLCISVITQPTRYFDLMALNQRCFGGVRLPGTRSLPRIARAQTVAANPFSCEVIEHENGER